MLNEVNAISEKIELLKTLEEYTIEIYVENGKSVYTVNFLNTDGSQSSISIPIEDIVYFTEYG